MALPWPPELRLPTPSLNIYGGTPMIFLYTFLLIFLGAIKMLIDRRVSRLEKRHTKTMKEVDLLLKEAQVKETSGGKIDPCRTAKRQVQLGTLVQHRDRLEIKYDWWLELSEKVGRWVTRLLEWKGRKLPYTMGVLDVSCLLYAIDQLGVGEYVNARHLYGLIATYFTN
jgi:hypothetical protein